MEIKQRVVEELRRIESQYDVRVLLAVESGSRAWGFASPDSDFDVRFIYVHQPQWYFSVFEQRDVIEEMLPGDLDVSGWELRKTLRLFAKCNLALNEWLGSDVVYHAIPEFKNQLAALIPSFFNPIAATHHYRSMAEASFNDNFSAGAIRIKKLFYVLRPLFACRWIEHAQSQPPTAFGALVEAPWVTQSEREWIADLLAKKAIAAEAASIPLQQQRADAIQSEIDQFKTLTNIAKSHAGANSSELDAVLRTWASIDK